MIKNTERNTATRRSLELAILLYKKVLILEVLHLDQGQFLLPSQTLLVQLTLFRNKTLNYFNTQQQ